MNEAVKGKFSLWKANWCLSYCMQSFIIVEYCFLFELEFILSCEFHIFEVFFFLGEKIYVIY